MGAVVALEVGLQRLSPVAIEVDDRLDVGLVHEGDKGPHVRCEPGPVRGQIRAPAQVVVGIDDGGGGTQDLVDANAQHRVWPVLTQRQVFPVPLHP